jgi:hypothetical protein
MLNLFELPHEAEDLEVIVHYFLGEDGRQGCQVIDSVVQLENLPTAVTLLILEQLHVEPVKKLRGMELGITGPDRGVQVSS